jgi:trigger factor
MVRKKFADAIRQEALDALIRDAYKEVVEKNDLKIASQPHVHDLKFEEGQPLTFEIHFEVRPTLELARTSGFRVTRRNVVVTDEMVRDQIDSIRDQRAAWTPVDGKPMPGDMVNVEISTGDEAAGGEARSFPLV